MKNKSSKYKWLIFFCCIIMVGFVTIVGFKTHPQSFRRFKELVLNRPLYSSANNETWASEDDYYSLEIGMTVKDVKYALGKNIMLTRKDIYSKSGEECYMCIVRDSQNRENTAFLTFDNGLLVEKKLYS